MANTKIVCTIGPASQTPEVIRKLAAGGMDVARLNFSHGTHEGHGSVIQTVRAVSEKLRKPVAILQDLCGPKIRVGHIPEPGIQLKSGQQFILTNREVEGSQNEVSISYGGLPREVKSDDRILLADGMLELVVRETGKTDIVCGVVRGGVLTSHKGINLPTGTIKVPALTPKDEVDLQFGLENDVDYVALSFVRKAEDIIQVKEIIRKAGKNIPVIAKIEKHEALDAINEIMDAADGIMVARGDLGVEIPLENVPNIQKMLIRMANSLGKPVIIATQMLRSMVDSPRPTRAEAADVANGVLDGADAVMLSEETAMGNYPVEAAVFMRRIIESAETGYPHEKYLNMMNRRGVSESVAYAACILADQIAAAAIVADARVRAYATRTGSTAAHISRFRPSRKLIALSPERSTVRRLALYWGCRPFYLPITEDTDQMIEKAAESAVDTGLVAAGAQVVITAGRPVWAEGTTNLLWVKTL